MQDNARVCADPCVPTIIGVCAGHELGCSSSLASLSRVGRLMLYTCSVNPVQPLAANPLIPRTLSPSLALESRSPFSHGVPEKWRVLRRGGLLAILDRVRFVILGTLVNCPALLFEGKKKIKESRIVHPRIRLG